MKKIVKLESLRGLLALYVVFHHSVHEFRIFNVDFSFIFKFGQEAVILFFLLSGFVIGLSFQNSRDKSFKTYFFKRFNRIYIPLFLVFVLNLSLFVIEEKLFHIDWREMIGNILMLQDVKSLKLNVIVSPFLGNIPLWSLAYEWWFYMLFYLVYKYCGHFSKLYIYIYVISLVAGISYLFYPFFINRILMYFMIWWIGYELANHYLSKSRISLNSVKVHLVFLTLLCLLLGYNVFLNLENWSNILNLKASIGVSPWLEFRHFTFSLISIILAIVWYKLKWFGFRNTIGLFTPLATISYCLYISHHFMVSTATYLNFIPFFWLRFFLYLCVCILFSYIIERIIFPKCNKFILSKI